MRNREELKKHKQEGDGIGLKSYLGNNLWALEQVTMYFLIVTNWDLYSYINVTMATSQVSIIRLNVLSFLSTNLHRKLKNLSYLTSPMIAAFSTKSCITL